MDGVLVEIRDQLPLQHGHIQFEPNFTFEDLLAELNAREFFWLGTQRGPRGPGEAHFRRYQANGWQVAMRCSLLELLAMNGVDRAYVAASNSGAPRSNSKSGYAIRGPSTFRLLDEAPFTTGMVKELSFRQSVPLPESTEWSSSLDGPWQRIWGHQPA